ncbi:hypothetical protein QZH41_002173 [Actinostola sp. cb2023]|nr:hypothetical protein QZH41_002173 [Actinostola sp. cb2023]
MEINDNSEQLVCDDASTNNRHPEPCSPPKTIAPSPKEMPHHASPIQSVMNFAQCNDVRYLLAPYRQHLLVQNEDGDTPIHLAIIHSLPHIDAFVSIVPSKDCLNIFNYLRQTPLHLAVITRQPSVVSLLLHAGASIDLVDRNGKTALHLACERGDVDIIRILTQFLINTHGSDSWAVDVMLNARDYKGFSALHLAVMTNGFDAIGLLVSLGANIDLPDGTSGRTAVPSCC